MAEERGKGRDDEDDDDEEEEFGSDEKLTPDKVGEGRGKAFTPPPIIMALTLGIDVTEDEEEEEEEGMEKCGEVDEIKSERASATPISFVR